VDLIYDYCRRGEKIEEESDGNIVGKGRIREVNGNEGVWILGRNNFPDLRQVKIIGPDSIHIGGERIGALRKLRDQCFKGFVGIIMVVVTWTGRWNVEFVDKFHA